MGVLSSVENAKDIDCVDPVLIKEKQMSELYISRK